MIYNQGTVASILLMELTGLSLKEKKRTKPQMQLYYSVNQNFCMKSYDGKGYETHLQRV